jgi:transposase-like protein
MENKTTPDLTLDEINQRFATDEAARAYWESIHWPNGPICPHCKNADAKLIYNVTDNKDKKIREGLRHCVKCSKQFTATIGTIFEDSHIPLRKWLIAWYMVCSSKKGISSLQLQRNLGLGSYRTALFMTHRIRYALQETEHPDKLEGTVEVDETYIGGRRKGAGRGSLEGKVPVVALVQRGGKVRSQTMKRITSKTLKAAVFKNVTPSSEIHTDENRGYQAVRSHYDHHTVKHAMGEYTRRENRPRND